MNLQSVFQSFSDTSPSLWDVEFAKQLATVNEQPLQNGFEELIPWTKEGKLWESPVNNEAGSGVHVQVCYMGNLSVMGVWCTDNFVTQALPLLGTGLGPTVILWVFWRHPGSAHCSEEYHIQSQKRQAPVGAALKLFEPVSWAAQGTSTTSALPATGDCGQAVTCKQIIFLHPYKVVYTYAIFSSSRIFIWFFFKVSIFLLRFCHLFTHSILFWIILKTYIEDGGATIWKESRSLNDHISGTFFLTNI
ncbi:uncharacterized protein LOC129011222 [Pongo pygmaeus]|uniref:uncharacterized protein LOC129011222 n=1 Tax=Pongo pygmaeus TaxID=9600 RepID=UPI0023E31B6A|nr:uncharacterized protein LOC129011222 [Pongo pygmaeus]